MLFYIHIQLNFLFFSPAERIPADQNAYLEFLYKADEQKAFILGALKLCLQMEESDIQMKNMRTEIEEDYLKENKVSILFIYNICYTTSLIFLCILYFLLYASCFHMLIQLQSKQQLKIYKHTQKKRLRTQSMFSPF